MADPAYPTNPRATDPRPVGPAAVVAPAADAAPPGPTARKTTTATSALGAEQWPAQATDAIVKVVDKVRDKTTGPITKVARAIVFGTFAAVVGLVALVVFSVLLVRFMNNYFFDHNVWAAHLVLGVLFTVAAAFLWTKAVAEPTRN